jgi:dTDP-glucose 4,6-dehydratase/UDP-glucose 4-epimerase
VAATRSYLVTGGAGFIGSALTRRLAGAGHAVTVLDDFSRGSAERLDGVPCEIIHGDIRDPLDVGNAMVGVDSVIHLAYLQGTQTFYEEPRQVLDVALRGMLSLMTACERWGVGELLLVSSSEAYQVAPTVPTPETVPLTVPDPLNPRYSYGGGKIACELIANAWHRTGVLDRVIIARPHNIIGPDMGREHVVPQFALRMNQIVSELTAEPDSPLPFHIQGTGQETRSFCHVHDCVTQLMLLLDKAPAQGIYHVGVEDERTIEDVAHEVARCYGREIKVIPGRLPEGSPPRRLPDTTKVRAMGFEPTCTFREAIQSTVAWYQAHG